MVKQEKTTSEYFHTSLLWLNIIIGFQHYFDNWFLSVITSFSSPRDIDPEPCFAGPLCDGSGFQPMKYNNWKVAGTLPSSFPYRPII